MNLNLEDYDVSTIEIKKNARFKKCYDVSLNIKNDYFNYNETRMSFEEYELWHLYKTLNKCINNELKEHKSLSLEEPDLEFEISKSADEDHIHLVEVKIYINLKCIVGPDYYSFLLCDDEVTKFRDYIGSVLNAKNN